MMQEHRFDGLTDSDAGKADARMLTTMSPLLDGSALTVEVMPLLIAGHQLVLGLPERRAINRELDGNGFVSAARIGEWVSIHWDWACQVLSLQQVANLERWTRYHLDIVNETL